MAHMKENKNSNAWENEYRDPQFLTLGTEPLGVVRDFMKWVKKEVRKKPEAFSAPLTDWTVLDAGCGNGKNLKYLIEHFCKFGIGYDISPTAIDMAREISQGLWTSYEIRSIGEVLPLGNDSIDLVLDVTSSNSLDESEREKFLKEISRVLKTSGYFFVRALCKDGDANAKKMLQEFPGPETDTYIIPGMGLTERVFSKTDFEKTYGKYFEILHLEKNSGYQKWGNQSYKRNYWVAYLRKK